MALHRLRAFAGSGQNMRRLSAAVVVATTLAAVVGVHMGSAARMNRDISPSLLESQHLLAQAFNSFDSLPEPLSAAAATMPAAAQAGYAARGFFDPAARSWALETSARFIRFGETVQQPRIRSAVKLAQRALRTIVSDGSKPDAFTSAYETAGRASERMFELCLRENQDATEVWLLTQQTARAYAKFHSDFPTVARLSTAPGHVVQDRYAALQRLLGATARATQRARADLQLEPAAAEVVASSATNLVEHYKDQVSRMASSDKAGYFARLDQVRAAVDRFLRGGA